MSCTPVSARQQTLTTIVIISSLMVVLLLLWLLLVLLLLIATLKHVLYPLHLQLRARTGLGPETWYQRT